MKVSQYSVLAMVLALALTGLATTARAGECTVVVTWSSGQAREGAKVSGSVNMGGVTTPIRTDSKGKAVIKWGSDYSLGKVFVEGTDRGSCKDGGTLNVVTKP